MFAFLEDLNRYKAASRFHVDRGSVQCANSVSVFRNRWRDLDDVPFLALRKVLKKTEHIQYKYTAELTLVTEDIHCRLRS